MFRPSHLEGVLHDHFDAASIKTLSVCNEFNRAVRDRAQGQEVTPVILKDALEFTFDRLRDRFDRHDVMQTLMHAGFRAPSAAMPDGMEMYGHLMEGRGRSADAFGRSVTGASPPLEDSHADFAYIPPRAIFGAPALVPFG